MAGKPGLSKGGSCPQPVLVSAQQSWAGAEPIPTPRWYPSPFTTSEKGFGGSSPTARLRDAVSI